MTHGTILLVCMPFGHVFAPSIALGLLEAELAEQGLCAESRYYSIRFAEIIGPFFYDGLSTGSRPTIEDLAGEWVFSHALRDEPATDDRYVDDILRRRITWTSNDPARPVSAGFIRQLLRARAQVGDFLRWCLRDVLAARPRLIGFTSMFQQQAASLALARVVKQASPETFIVFGGANCEGIMGAELVRQFPFVDAVVSGEADLLFPEVARRVLEGQPVAGLPGVRTRGTVAEEFARGRFPGGPLVRDLDRLPPPDYRGYFAQYAESRFARRWRPRIFFETSRGCWWGEKMHCTFCGLNGQTMAFRSKSAERAVEELRILTERHPDSRVMVTDNILDMRYLKDFIPRLAARPKGPELFYEVKANLKKPQLRLLRDARISSIQPGIESLSDPVLRLMRKGVSALQNIQLLKWCKELSVDPAWNIIWGFPGEPPEEYERMASLVPLLAHLRPPDGSAMIRLDRFSPNYDQATELGFEDVSPLPPYAYIYPVSSEALANMAYYFTFRYREPRDVKRYVGGLSRVLRRWRSRWLQSDLFSVEAGSGLLIWDSRPGGRPLLTVLRGAQRTLYQALDGAADAKSLSVTLERAGHGRMATAAIEQLLQPLVDGGLLLRDGSRYLALAVALGEYTPSARAAKRFYEVVASQGRATKGGWVVTTEGAAPRRAAAVGRRAKRIGRASHHADRPLRPSQFRLRGPNEVLVKC